MGVFQGVIFVLVFGQIALRLIGVTVPWASEVAQYSNVVIVFCGLPAITYRKSHIVMDTLSNKIPQAYLRYYYAFASFTLLVFYSFAILGFLAYMPASRTVTLVSLLWVPMNLIYGVSLGGLLLACVSCLINIALYLFAKKEDVELFLKEVAQ